MNNVYVQHSGVARFWAVITMCAVVLSAFSAPFSVASAEETTEPVVEEVVVSEVEVEAETEDVVVEDIVEEDVTEEPVTTPEDVVVTTDSEEPTTEETTEVVEEEVVEEVVEVETPVEETFTPQVSFRSFSIESVVDEVIQCTDELDGDWSDNVVSTNQAKRKDGSDVLPARSIAEAALTNMPVDGSTGFYSLGFGGSIILSFDKFVVNFALGTDLTVIETTNLPYPTETAMVEVSQDGVTWVFAGLAVDAGGNYFDFDSIDLDWIRFVRITDTSNPALFPNDGDGFDVSAVIAKQGVCELPEPETETITVCKYAGNEQSISGWDMTISNNQSEDDLVTYNLETGEDGCVSQEVDPLVGPFYVTEIGQKGWEQVAVWVEGGYVADSEGGEFCTFFAPQEEVFALTDNVSEEPTYRCNFMNREVEQLVCEAEVNLVQNGSFETPNLPGDGFGWDIYESVSNGLVWVVDWVNPTEDSPVPAELELQSGYYTASHGVQYAELDSNWNPAPGGVYNGEDARVSIYQEIATIPGNTYTVSYDFSALPRRAADTNILKVLLDEAEVAEHTADGVGQTDTVWTSYSYSFVATTTVARVGFADAGLSDSFGTLLDNVSVECSPTTIPEEEEEEPTPTSNRRNGGGGGTLVRPTPTVAGDSISAPTPAPMVLGEQVTAVPYGAPGTGNGGSAQQSSLTLGNILFLATRRSNTK